MEWVSVDKELPQLDRLVIVRHRSWVTVHSREVYHVNYGFGCLREENNRNINSIAELVWNTRFLWDDIWGTSFGDNITDWAYID